MSTAENKKLVQQIFGESATRSGSGFVDAMADDVCWIITGQWSWSQTFKGKDAVVNNLMTTVRSLLQDRISSVAYNFVADGDTVVVETKGNNNFTKTGNRYDNEYCFVIKLENGKIKQIKEYLDSALVEKAMGPWPGPKATA